MKLIDSSKFKMSRDEFDTEFAEMCYAKGITSVSALMIEAYWKDLKDFLMLKETFEEARNITYYRDFNRSVPRLPESSELKRLSYQLWNSKIRKLEKIERDRESAENDTIRLLKREKHEKSQ